jgi:hypothetical protein
MSIERIQALRTLAAEAGRLLGWIPLREVVCAASGLKPVRLTLAEDVCGEVDRLLRSHGLHVQPGSTTLRMAADEGKGGWSSSSRTDGEGEEARHLYVAIDDATAIEIREADEAGDDERFGRALLIPACCREMFARTASEAASLQFDFFRYSFREPTSICPWTLNLGAQYFDASFISHYPCGPDCEASTRVADLARRLFTAAAPALCRRGEALMQSIAIYTERSGVHLLPGAEIRDGWIVGAGRVHSTTQAAGLHAALAAASMIRCESVNRIELVERGAVRVIECEGARVVIPTGGASS